MKELVTNSNVLIRIQQNLGRLLNLYVQLFSHGGSPLNDSLVNWPVACRVKFADKLTKNIRAIKDSEFRDQLIKVAIDEDNCRFCRIMSVRSLPDISKEGRDLLKRMVKNRDLSVGLRLACIERLAREGEMEFVLSRLRNDQMLRIWWLTCLETTFYELNSIPHNRWLALEPGEISLEENPECFICSRLIEINGSTVQRFLKEIFTSDDFGQAEKAMIAYFLWKHNRYITLAKGEFFDQILANQELNIPQEIFWPTANDEASLRISLDYGDFRRFAYLFFPYRFFLAHVVQLNDSKAYQEIIHYLLKNKNRFPESRRKSFNRPVHPLGIFYDCPESEYIRDLACILPGIIALKQSNSVDAINCLLELISDKSLDLFLRQAGIYALEGRNLGDLEGKVHSLLENIAVDQEEAIRLRWQAIFALRDVKQFGVEFYIELLKATHAKYEDGSLFAEESAFRPISQLIIECLKNKTDPQISNFLSEALSEGKLLQNWGWQSSYVIPLVCQSQNPDLIEKLCQAVFEEFRKSNSEFQRLRLLGVLAQVTQQVKDAEIEEFIIQLIKPSEFETHAVIRDPSELGKAFEILGYVAPHRIPDLLYFIENLSSTDFRLFIACLRSAPNYKELLPFFEHLVARHFVETEDVSALELYSDILSEHQSPETAETLLRITLSGTVTSKVILAAYALNGIVIRSVG
ncbi:MAG: hypothetical protein NZT61_03215 [Deltaproteobacteria bacterium]|nr:hypothetical protein [Deltaproteobacteria bacterium]